MKHLVAIIIFMLLTALHAADKTSPTHCIPQEGVHPNDPANKHLLIRTLEYQKFHADAEKLHKYRAEHLVDVPTMLKMIEKNKAFLVDVRSKEIYEREHIKGALNLSVADITDLNLAKILPSKDTPIILYCDESIQWAPSRRIPASSMAYPAFYQSGYTNLYEMKPLWQENDPKEKYKLIPFESESTTSAKPTSVPTP